MHRLKQLITIKMKVIIRIFSKILRNMQIDKRENICNQNNIFKLLLEYNPTSYSVRKKSKPIETRFLKIIYKI